MHGLGNDFMVLDLSRIDLRLSPRQIQRLADRHRGIGFDQLLQIHPPDSPTADFNYRVFNVDGSESEHCGNGARCIARYIADKGLSRRNPLRVKTVNRLLHLSLHDDGGVSVDMGAPEFDPARIPLRAPKRALTYRRRLPGLQQSGAQVAGRTDAARQADGRGEAPKEVEFSALSMGNPHAVIVVDRLSDAMVAALGPALGRHPDFPEGVNVGFMAVRSRAEVELRVVERGIGETLACGTGACAAVVAGRQRGLLDEAVTVHLRGGDLHIRYGQNQSVLMTGPAETVYEGSIEIRDHER